MARLSIREATERLTGPGSLFEVQTVVVRGREMRTWKHAPRTLRTLVTFSQNYSDRTYLVYENERLTYEQAYARIAALSERLVRVFGVRKGDRVAIAMRNLPEWPIAFWAAACAGAVVVPLNAWWTRSELEYALVDSGARLVVVDTERLERLRPYLQKTRTSAIVARANEPLQGSERSLEELVTDGPSVVELPRVHLEPDDDATIFYTSGTTGKPKGALGTHRNICVNVLSSIFSTARSSLRYDDSPRKRSAEQFAMLVSVPFFHVAGCHGALAGTTAAGGKLVIMQRWDPERALELIERERVATFGGVPGMALQVAESTRFAEYDSSSVDRVIYGGAPAGSELVRRIRKAFPSAHPNNSYGLTESSAVACSNCSEDYARKPDSVGLPVPICDVKVVSRDGRTLPAGEIGEICLFGPNIVKGYWKDETATRETFREGWLHTGDLGSIDEEGFVYLLDRAKDMLIRGGENVYSAEVEDALYAHPDVLDAAVVGLPHRVLGEEPAAVVQIVTGSVVTEEALQRLVRERLAAFKVPVRVELRTDPLPRNEAGKVLKPSLREALMARLEPLPRTAAFEID